MTVRQIAIVAFVACGCAAIAAAGKNPPRQTLPATVHSVVVVTDPALTKPARHGVEAVEDALRAKRISVSEEVSQIGKADVVVLAGLASGAGPAGRTLHAMNAQSPSEPESLTVRSGARYESRPALVLAGGDDAGLMYAALDTADRVAWTAAGSSCVVVTSAQVPSDSRVSAHRELLFRMSRETAVDRLGA